MARRILLLHEAGDAPAAATALAEDLRAQGAEVAMRPCEAPYDAVLDALAEADSVLFWN